jgi:putative peptidoglycan lipid II flippase
VLSLTLTNIIGAYGIPLAYSVASLTGLVVLLIALRRKIGQYCKGLGTNFVKCVISGIIMAIAVIAVSYVLDGVLATDTFMVRLVKLGVPVCIGVVVYAVMVIILKVDAVKPIVDVIKRKVFKKA